MKDNILRVSYEKPRGFIRDSAQYLENIGRAIKQSDWLILVVGPLNYNIHHSLVIISISLYKNGTPFTFPE